MQLVACRYIAGSHHTQSNCTTQTHRPTHLALPYLPTSLPTYRPLVPTDLHTYEHAPVHIGRLRVQPVVKLSRCMHLHIPQCARCLGSTWPISQRADSHELRPDADGLLRSFEAPTAEGCGAQTGAKAGPYCVRCSTTPGRGRQVAGRCLRPVHTFTYVRTYIHIRALHRCFGLRTVCSEILIVSCNSIDIHPRAFCQCRHQQKCRVARTNDLLHEASTTQRPAKSTATPFDLCSLTLCVSLALSFYVSRCTISTKRFRLLVTQVDPHRMQEMEEVWCCSRISRHESLSFSPADLQLLMGHSDTSSMATSSVSTE